MSTIHKTKAELSLAAKPILVELDRSRFDLEKFMPRTPDLFCPLEGPLKRMWHRLARRIKPTVRRILKFS